MASGTETTTLDFIDNISVPSNVFEPAGNEYSALMDLRVGMQHLYDNVRACDEFVRQRINPDGTMKCQVLGNHPSLAGANQPMISCSFHWYALAACQYVKIIGCIARENGSNLLPAEYVKQVIPDVLVYRNKVAAHYAWTSPDKRDTQVQNELSKLPSLRFMNTAFHVGGLTLNRNGETATFPEWSIQSVHARLRKRYWPERA